ncbi:uncharacterized protein METZ01_LOCUS390584, partial [marine metagenome]
MTDKDISPKGTIIFLNGSSSAGKTTLAMALQEQLEEPFQYVALDQFRDGMPAKYRGLNSPDGSTGQRGLNVVPVDSGDVPAFTSIQFGDEGKLMLRGMRRAMATMANEGVHLLIDDIILERGFLEDYLQAMLGIDLYFVGVHCPAEVISEREAVRPGRFPGTAVGHLHICHAHGDYDVEVDTSRQSPEECARDVIKRVNAGPPEAFARLRR